MKIKILDLKDISYKKFTIDNSGNIIFPSLYETPDTKWIFYDGKFYISRFDVELSRYIFSTIIMVSFEEDEQ